MFRGWSGMASAIVLPVLLTPVWCQSRYAAIFEKFARTGDRSTFLHEMSDANQGPTDIRVEVPVLVEVIASSNNSPIAQEEARGRLCMLAFSRPLAYDNPIEREIFRPLVSVFEWHLNEAEKDSESKWGVSIVALTAHLGFPPSPQALTLIYRMLNYRDQRAQATALLALSRLRPLPEEAKRVLFSRLEKLGGKASGPETLSILAYAIQDSDVLQTFVKFAESADVNEQEIATETLSRLTPIPESAVEVFRRLRKRDDLDSRVEANVKAAIRRIDNRVPIENQEE